MMFFRETVYPHEEIVAVVPEQHEAPDGVRDHGWVQQGRQPQLHYEGKPHQR